MSQAAGSICLGIVMGWLVRYFLSRFTQFNVRILATVASVLCGGAVIKLLGSEAFQNSIQWYPIGLLLGITLCYPVMVVIDDEFRPKGETNDVLSRIEDLERQVTTLRERA